MSGQAISYLAEILDEQKKQSAILERMAEQQCLLIQAMAEDEPEDSDAQPLRYMDGTPCR
ncbi:YebO family protein [Pseudomonas umsongensis]|uniref:YebO family protein n=1 Tax=Pseudomonas umsongensis TaxID=198618 RepID=UPI00200B2036|nr:YebO family protein [Pseudomonas umsongensis]MCK8688383.1 YebO family protein [Pseudomonas umsongensis]